MEEKKSDRSRKKKIKSVETKTENEFWKWPTLELSYEYIKEIRRKVKGN